MTATIEIPGQEPIELGAWIIVAPPDFAPASRGVVTLYDVIRQVAIDEGWLEAPQTVNFDRDVRPIIERASSLRYVHPSGIWNIETDWARLSDPSSAATQLRDEVAAQIREVEDGILRDVEFRQWQNDVLDAWVEGNFNNGPAPEYDSAAAITHAVLDATLGQGLFPGIEAGVNLLDPRIYVQDPFEYRINHERLSPGDLTALMALPWQADFLKCRSGWWPAQRPDHAPRANGSPLDWLRPTMNHERLVDDVMKLGVISQNEEGEVVEGGRDPSLGT